MVKIHSAVTVSIQRSQRADAVVVHTDKLKQFLGSPPRSWLLNNADEPSATREMGTISAPKSPECDQGFMRPPAEERLADHSQVEDPGGDGYGLSPPIPRTPRASRTRRPSLYLNEYIRCVRSNVFSSDDKTMAATT